MPAKYIKGEQEKMKKIKKIIRILLLIVIMCSLVKFNNVFASNMTISLKVDKEKAKVGEEIVITVNWEDKMQAADYILKYDSTKLQYIKSSIGEDFINTSNNGQIGVSWFSSDNTDLQEMKFTFKIIGEGQSKMSIEIDGGFADGELNSPDNYDVTSKGNITLDFSKEANNTITYILIICAVLIVIAVVIEKKHKKNK